MGIDPYTQAISDVYQDLSGEGSYHGKGIYDVRAFSRVLSGRFPEEWVLVFHGWGNPVVINKIKRLDYNKKVFLSLNMVPSDQIKEIIASADVGLVLYSSEVLNDKLTAFSSEKIAYYMQCGVPFIGFNYPGYKRLEDEERCGVTIRSIKDIPAAINKILNACNEFQQNAYKTYYKYYDFTNNFTGVIKGVEKLSNPEAANVN